MPGVVLTVSASGIEDHLPYVDILREHENELAANGAEYEEHDRKAEPVTAALIISIAVKTLVAAPLAEIIKRIFHKLWKTWDEKSKKQAKPTIIILRIGREEYDLGKDLDEAIAKIDTLKNDG